MLKSSMTTGKIGAALEVNPRWQLPTWFLHDEGEEQWANKIHLGAGSVYLSGYTNVDIVGELANAVDIPSSNISDIADYYSGRQGTIQQLPDPHETVVDLLADFRDPPYAPSTVSKIICVQALEHLPSEQVRQTLANWWTILKPNAPLIISVPDMDNTLKLLEESATRDFAVRHLSGSRKDAYSYHKSWYREQDLVELLAEHGFKDVTVLPNFHLYPALVVKARKADLFVPDRSYQQPLPGCDESCQTVLDVGPGKYPLPFATHCLDIDDTYKDYRLLPADLGNVEELPYSNQSYDFVYCSHVLEHTHSPVQALAELQRVGKRGYVEVPTAMLDYFMQHSNVHPHWLCLQMLNGIIFVEHEPDKLDAFGDETMKNYIHRLTHYNVSLSDNERHLREVYWRNMDALNASTSWEPGRTAKAMEIHLDGTVIGSD